MPLGDLERVPGARLISCGKRIRKRATTLTGRIEVIRQVEGAIRVKRLDSLGGDAVQSAPLPLRQPLQQCLAQLVVNEEVPGSFRIPPEDMPALRLPKTGEELAGGLAGERCDSL